MFAVSKTGETVDVSVRNLYKAAHACPLLHIYDNKEEGKQNFTVIYLITHCEEFKDNDNSPHYWVHSLLEGNLHVP